MAVVTTPLIPREVDFIPTEDLMALTPVQLRSFVMRGGLFEVKKGPWSHEESQRLITLVQLMGPQDWVSIASYMATRNAKQCRERYHQNLDPSLRHDPITDEEAQLIMELYAKFGTAWARIAEHLPGRSDNAIKNYVNGLVNKNRRAEERQAGQSAAGRRGSDLSIRSGASASASAPVSAVTALTPSPFGSQALESPTLSDMADSDSSNHYALSSASSWHQRLAQSPELTLPPAHHPSPYQQLAYGSSTSGQNSHGYASRQEAWRPESRSSEPSSFLGTSFGSSSMDLARYSISGPASRELPRDMAMQNVDFPRLQPLWAAVNDSTHTQTQSPAEPSSAAMPLGHRVDPRMCISNLLE